MHGERNPLIGLTAPRLFVKLKMAIYAYSIHKNETRKVAKIVSTDPPKNLKGLIETTNKLWRKHHLTYDQARYISKEVRKLWR